MINAVKGRTSSLGNGSYLPFLELKGYFGNCFQVVL